MPEAATEQPGQKTPATPPTPESKTELGAQTATDWRSGLPDDLRGDPSLASIKDVGALAKSFVHAQKLVGTDKVAIPKSDAPPEAWAEVWNRLGRPETPDGYQIPEQLPEGLKVDPERSKKFFAEAHRLGLNGQQAAAMVRYAAEEEVGRGKAAQDAFVQGREQTIEGLRKEWGGAYDQNMAITIEAAKRFFGDEGVKHLDATGMGNDPVLIRGLHKIGRMISQDEVLGRGGRASFVMSPGEAQAEMDKLYSDAEFSKAYYDKAHPGHKSANDRMTKLSQTAWPEEKR